MRDFHGVYIPVPTPFRGEQVAVDGLRANFTRWNATVLAGYVVLGSTGEFPMLSESEQDTVLVAALDLQGYYGGPCRAPLVTPDGDAIDEITESLASAGLL